MLEIFIYAFGIMYTPGPVNLLTLNAGLHAQVRSTLAFCVGVGCAMLILFLLFGYTGAWLVQPSYQIVISILGSFYIAYLAFKIAQSSTANTRFDQSSKRSVDLRSNSAKTLTFKAGLMMQLLNPKAFIAILPIATIQFPAAGVSGGLIAIYALLLSTLAFGAPTCYLLMGARLSQFISRASYFRYINLGLSALLFFIAGDIFYGHVLQVLIS